jgi:hypothetical protein
MPYNNGTVNEKLLHPIYLLADNSNKALILHSKQTNYQLEQGKFVELVSFNEELAGGRPYLQ